MLLCLLAALVTGADSIAPVAVGSSSIDSFPPIMTNSRPAQLLAVTSSARHHSSYLPLRGGPDRSEAPGGGGGRGWLGLATLVGPGTLISALHAANKALVCWCTDATLRETVVKVADVGFLGLLGSMSLAAGWNAVDNPLTRVQPLILETAFSHLVLEMAVNGLAIPAMCASEVEERGRDIALSKRQEIMQKAVKGNVAQSKTGLRRDIWLHHVLAVSAFAIVLMRGEFQEEATMLTSVECTCALPVAFGQAAKAKQLKGARSLVLGGLMTLGFVMRVLLTAKLTLPRVLQVWSALGASLRGDGNKGMAEPLRSVSGRVLEGSITEPHRLVLVGCSFGLTALNAVWLCKIVAGIFKVITRGGKRSKDKGSGAGDHVAPETRQHAQTTDIPSSPR